MNVGGQQLFRYNVHDGDGTAWSRYCDYQVARLFDDLIGLVPGALAAVPRQLHPFLSGDMAMSWRGYWDAWCSLPDRFPEMDALDRVLWEAGELYRLRTLDTFYLQPSTDILMWSSSDQVHIQWDNRGKMVDGAPAWTAAQGSLALTRDRFIAEVRNFCVRLCDAMEERIRQVEQGALAPDIHVDLKKLNLEQELRRHQLDHVLANPRYTDDWPAITAAVEKLERLRSRYRS